MNKRNPYLRGCKDFLSTIEIGDEVEVPSTLRYDSVKVVAAHLRYEYGCQFSFRTHEGKHYAKRLS